MFLRSCFLLSLLFLPHNLTAQTTTAMPRLGHVVVVVEENKDYGSIIGNSAAPYLNSLANQYGLATNYYANAHFSIGNYFMMTTGELITGDDAYTCAITTDDLAAELTAAGKTWKVYAESIPSVGYTGGDAYPYVKRHNPFAYMKEALTGGQQGNIVPFSQFAADLSSNTLPNFSFVVPNMQNNMHDCPAGMSTCTNNDRILNADKWLQANIAPLHTNSTFQQDGMLIVTFDEASTADTRHGGGQIATVVAGVSVKPGYRSTSFFQHQSILRTVLEAFGISTFPGASQYSPSLAEFVQALPPGTVTGTVTDAATGNPLAGATVAGAGSATTDAGGLYTLSPVAAGTYTLTASASGHQNSSHSVSVPSGSTVTQNFALTSLENGSLAGRVTNAADGHSVSGASVSYSGGSVLTDTNGNYSFPAIGAGTYNVSASKTGLLKSTQSVTITSGVASTLNFKLAASGVIHGSVTNGRTGTTISGASVTVVGGVIATNKSLVTSSTGVYSSSWIPVGSYTVTVTSGSTTKTQNVTLSSGQQLTVNFTLP